MKPQLAPNDYTSEQLEEIKVYLADQTKLPSFIGKSRASKWRFKRRFSSGAYSVQDEIVHWKGVPLVPIENKEALIQELYNNVESRLNGITRFWHRPKEVAGNISQQDVTEFLRKQELYQLTRPVIKQRIVKPIVPAKKLVHW